MKTIKKAAYSLFILSIALLVSGSLLCFFSPGTNAYMGNMTMMSNNSSAFAMQHNGAKSTVPECCVNQKNNEKANIGSGDSYQEKIIAVAINTVEIEPTTNTEKNIIATLSNASPPWRESLSSIVILV